MNYITEAARLGVPFGPLYGTVNEDGTALRRPWRNENIRVEDGLCVSGCSNCRSFRNDVRAAIVAEREQAAAAEQRITDSEQNLADWAAEEEHVIEAFDEVLRHIELLPPSDLRQAALYGLQATITSTRLAFRANSEAQNVAHDELVGGNIDAGADVPGQERSDPIADLLALFAAPGADVQFVSTFED